MVREEVRDLFIRRGFNLREDKMISYHTVVEHNGEVVGTIYAGEVYIVDNYPSLNQGKSQTYADTTKTIVSFKKPLRMVEDAIEFLLDSPRRIDRAMRDKRVENVKRYFDRRRTIAKIENAWDEVPSWRKYEAEQN